MAGVYVPVNAYIDRLSGLTEYDGFEEGLELLSQASGMSFRAKKMGGVALGGPKRRCDLTRLYRLPRHAGINVILTRRSLDSPEDASVKFSMEGDGAVIGVAHTQFGPDRLRIAAVDVITSDSPAATVAHEVAHLLELYPPKPAQNDLVHCEDISCVMAADEVLLDTGITQELFCDLCIGGLKKAAAEFAP